MIRKIKINVGYCSTWEDDGPLRVSTESIKALFDCNIIFPIVTPGELVASESQIIEPIIDESIPKLVQF